jgi:hypothetical protein
MRMAERFREQAQACARMGSPMYGALLDRAAGDIERGGATRSVLEGHEHDPGPSALALRLAGSVHWLVLAGRAAEVARYYPSVGGAWDPDAGWTAVQRLLRDRPDEVRARLDRPPQTNEVGRSATLMGGLLDIGVTFRHPVRLIEIGASGGLNLNADRYGYTDADDRVFGDEASLLMLRRAWRGRALSPWPGLQIVERVGSDSLPVDVSGDDGRRTLTSYVWPDQADRLDRLRSAFAVAQEHPTPVRRRDARSVVDELHLAEGTTTVLWHSVMWQYLTRVDKAAVQARIDALATEASAGAPFAHLWLEPARRAANRDHEFLVVLELWPDGGRRVLGTAHPHGVPAIWE